MFCKNCGRQVDEREIICRGCGYRLDEEPTNGFVAFGSKLLAWFVIFLCVIVFLFIFIFSNSDVAHMLFELFV